jgi:hypothetical protein
MYTSATRITRISTYPLLIAYPNPRESLREIDELTSKTSMRRFSMFWLRFGGSTLFKLRFWHIL